MTRVDTAKTIKERAACLDKIAREVRERIINMIYRAGSGHPGGALSAADIATALYFDILNIDPKNPRWPDRDRFILSKGHACPVLYACLAMRGYFASKHLDTLRKFESILQGHPIHKTPGVDMTTGSLGHGLSIGLGMALDGRLRKKDYYVYVLLGDGEINEGLVWEAAMACSKFHLDTLIAIIDKNRLQMDGACEDVMPTGDIASKFRAFGWEAFNMDGHNMEDILLTVEKAYKVKGRPVAIVADTVKGRGVSYMENRFEWHGKCPDRDQYKCALKEIREAEQ
ncbi:MAG: transketolase [Deltaproteobacteria bacterium]|nr:transketolase [Deltaproteobacteria bacterium]